MQSNLTKLAEVFARQASAVERKLAALRQSHRDQLKALRQVEQSRGFCEMQLRQDADSRRIVTTPRQLSAASDDRSLILATMQDLSTQASELRATMDELGKQRRAFSQELLRLQHKTDHLRRRAARAEKQRSRRRFARDIAGASAVAAE